MTIYRPTVAQEMGGDHSINKATLWLTIAFFKRRSLVPKHYIIWLLITLLLAIKAFAFSPVSDVLALRQLLFPLLAAALLAPYFRRSQRVKRTFVNP